MVRDNACSLHIKGLAGISQDDLRDEFSKYGELKDVYIPRFFRSGELRDFGYVEFFKRDDAEAAFEKTRDGVDIGGKSVVVDFAKGQRKNRADTVEADIAEAGVEAHMTEDQDIEGEVVRIHAQDITQDQGPGREGALLDVTVMIVDVNIVTHDHVLTHVQDPQEGALLDVTVMIIDVNIVAHDHVQDPQEGAMIV
ncbi:Arginine/serine-rich splicing factor scl25a transcript I [Mycoemilia scoparia]|uniref:Arginine/serine-rich splicing factor scl25a transcript I n=1 Tax=Mycoemilia scoparia TaxID=417184 RepID=A0A9W8DTI2_9FUNG|nr:Arginine/serine-rich splicing factor scl25a transcript I [Mycoemilia scoparia]